MARPKKQTVDYFPHVASSGKTMYILESQFGNDGYAFWFKTLELLASTDGHVIDCRNQAEWRFLLAKTNVDEVTANSILVLLSELDAIDNELWGYRIIWSDNFLNNISDVYKNRKAELPKKPIHLVSNSRNYSTDELSPVETMSEADYNQLTTNRNPQSKVKETKVNNTKVNNNKNDFVDNGINPDDVINFYQNNFGMMSPYVMENISKWCDEINAEVVLEACKVSVTMGKTNYNYINAILNNWQKRNVKSVEDVKALQVAHENQKKSSKYSKRSNHKEPIPGWMGDLDETPKEKTREVDDQPQQELMDEEVIRARLNKLLGKESE